jgi:AdoMet-dependent heme synthase
METCAQNELSTSEAKEMLGGLAEVGREQGTMPVIVFSGGEPLLRMDIMDLVAHSASLSLTPALATNGTLIDAGSALRLKAAGVARVSVSVDGSTAGMHDGIRGQQWSFERAMSGIAELRKAGVPFQLNFTLTRRNADDLAAVYSLAKSVGAVALHVFILVPVGCGRELADTEVLEPAGYEQRMLEIAGLADDDSMQVKVTCGPQYERIIRQQRKLSTGHGHSRGCLAGRGVLFVSHTGMVFPCGYLPIECGNVRNSSLGAIWRSSDELTMLRDSSKLKGKCGICQYNDVCGGCRARAYAVTRDQFAEEPSCAFVPGAGRHG